METTTPAEVAGMVTWFGVLGVIVAALALIAVGLVRAEAVPAHVRRRARWWSAHHVGFMLGGLALALGGLAGLAVA